jgi:hypothetical protein
MQDGVAWRSAAWRGGHADQKKSCKLVGLQIPPVCYLRVDKHESAAFRLEELHVRMQNVMRQVVLRDLVHGCKPIAGLCTSGGAHRL